MQKGYSEYEPLHCFAKGSRSWELYQSGGAAGIYAACPRSDDRLAGTRTEYKTALPYQPPGLPDAGGRAYFPSHSKIGIAISCDAGDCQIFPADGFDFDRREREMAGIRNIVTDKDLTRDGKWKYNWTERKQQE